MSRIGAASAAAPRRGAFASLATMPGAGDAAGPPAQAPAPRAEPAPGGGDLLALPGGLAGGAALRGQPSVRPAARAGGPATARAPMGAGAAGHAAPWGDNVMPHPAARRPASAASASGRYALINVRREALATARLRAMWVLLGFVTIALAALMRVVYLGCGEARHSGTDAAGPERGTITDRNDVPLASDFPAHALWFNPGAVAGGAPLIKSPAEVADALVAILPGLDRGELIRRLSRGHIPCNKADTGRHCLGWQGSMLKRRIMPEEANRILALGEPALEFPRVTVRLYPQGSMGAAVLGFMGVDKAGHVIGKVGMEAAWQQALTDRATRGTPQVLSIDARVQGAVEDGIGWGMAMSGAKGGAGIVMDVDTGEVLALASLPAFNPNLIDQASVGNIFNRATNGIYELGSVMKPVTIATAIDDGVVTDLAKRYPAVPFTFDHRLIHDNETFAPTLDVPEALVHSSNIVTAEIADQVGAARLAATMRALRFHLPPAIELPARGTPRLPPADNHGTWARISAMTVGYGHGIEITPLHLACAYAALVNGGIWRPATLRRLDPGAVPAGTRIWSASTSARMRQLLRAIVVKGTGKSAEAPGFRIGGKTGTAEQWDNRMRKYRGDVNVTTFAAAFPMDHPRYVFIVTLDSPQATAAASFQRTAAYNAAPVVARVVPRIGPMLGVMPDMQHDIDISDILPLIANGNGE